MEVPFHKQINNYTCGPASLQMVFDYFGTHLKQEDLAKMLGTSSLDGTDHSSLIEVVTKNGFHCYVNNNSTLFEVKHFVTLELPVIVNYIEPTDDEGHFAVVAGYDEETLILNDPWNGKGFTINEQDFVDRWYSETGKHRRWIMVLAKESFHLGKQYLPTDK